METNWFYGDVYKSWSNCINFFQTWLTSNFFQTSSFPEFLGDFSWMVIVGKNCFHLKLKFLIAMFSFCTITETFLNCIEKLNWAPMVCFWSILLKYASCCCHHIFLDWNVQELFKNVSLLTASSIFDNKCDEDSDLFFDTACIFSLKILYQRLMSFVDVKKL